MADLEDFAAAVGALLKGRAVTRAALSDANAITTPGLHHVAAGATSNLPFAGSGTVLQLPAGNGGAHIQVAYEYGNTLNAYQRYGSGTSWQPWGKTTWHNQTPVSHVDDALPGVTPVLVPTTPGLPVQASATITTVPFTPANAIQTALTWEDAPRTFHRIKSQGTWKAWTAADAPPAQLASYKPAGGIGTDATGVTTTTQRTLIDIPAPTSRWRLRVYNNHLRFSVANRPGVTLTGAWIGKPATSNGVPAGGFQAAPVQALTEWTPTGTLDWVSDWVTAPAAQLDGTMLLSLGWTGDGSAIQQTMGLFWTAPDAGLASQQAATGLTATTTGLLDVVVEYEHGTGTESVLWIGDSQSQGSGVGDHRLSHPHLYGRAHRVPVISGGYSGSGVLNYSSTAYRSWGHLGAVAPTTLVIELGTNDLAAQTLATIQAGILTIAENARTLYPIRRVWVMTIPPRGATAGSTIETRRAEVNAWLRSNPVGIDAVIDADRILRDPANPLRLAPEYEQADRLHWTAAGQAAIAAAIPAP